MQRRVARSIELVSNAIGIRLMPYLHSTFVLLSENFERFARFLRSYAGIASFFRRVFDPLFNKLRGYIDQWDRHYMSIEETIYRVGRAALLLGSILSGSKFVAYIGLVNFFTRAVGFALLAIDDLVTFIQDPRPGQSLIGTFIKTSPMLKSFAAAAKAIWSTLYASFKNIQKTLDIIARGPILPWLTYTLQVLGILGASAFYTLTSAALLFTAALSVMLEPLGMLVAFLSELGKGRLNLTMLGQMVKGFWPGTAAGNAGLVPRGGISQGNNSNFNAWWLGPQQMGRAGANFPTRGNNVNVTINSPNPAASANASVGVGGRLARALN
jgi:hypothetical protein